MDLKEAMKTLTKEIQGRFIIGYWDKGDRYVFNTKPLNFLKNTQSPNQYVVTKDGKVYATNPMREDLDISMMKKIR